MIIIIIIITIAVFCHHRYRLQETCAMNVTFPVIRSQLDRVNFYSLVILYTTSSFILNPLNAELNPICHLLALLAHHIFHVSGLRVNQQTNRHCKKLSTRHNFGLQFQPFALNFHRTKLLHFLKHLS